MAKNRKPYAGQIPWTQTEGGSIPDYIDSEFRVVYEHWQVKKDENGEPVMERCIFWRDNVPFYARMAFQGFSRGRSAANALFKDEEKGRFTMFLTDVADVINERGLPPGGVLEGLFDGVKRGSNYGIRYLGPGDGSD